MLTRLQSILCLHEWEFFAGHVYNVNFKHSKSEEWRKKNNAFYSGRFFLPSMPKDGARTPHGQI
jgi:hypothetical protein